MHTIRTLFLLLLVLATIAACQSRGTPTVEPTALPPATATDTPVAAAPADTPAPPTVAPPELADILTILGRADGLEEFVRLVEQVDLTEKLSGLGPYTVFIPPTVAFQNLPAGVLDDAAMLQDILLYHIVEGKFTLESLTAPTTAINLYGDELSLLLGGEGATVYGVNVLGGDFEARNGMIHIIDTVMLPPDIADEILALYPSMAGEETMLMQGNLHIAQNETSPVPYNSTPPTSGPHYGNIVAWQVYEEPIRYEQLVHNLEDAGVIIYYQCDAGCSELVEQLRGVAQPYLDEGRRVVVALNDPTWTLPDGSQPHGDIEAPIVVTAWRKLLKLDEFDAAAIQTFIDAYEGIDHHVK